MKITYDNIIFSLQRAGGISIYWSELIKRLVKKKSVFLEKEGHNIFRKGIDIKTHRESVLPISLLRYLPIMKRLPKNSIFHSSYYRVSLQKSIFNITTVHDFTYEYFRAGMAKHIHTWQKGFAIKKSDGIICVSENTKKDLLKLYPKIEHSKIKVIYNGVGKEFDMLDKAEEFLFDELKILKGKNYILYIGDRSSYKNFDLTVDVMKKIEGYSLVVVGGKEFDEKEKINLESIRDRCYHFRSIDGGKLNVLYNNAFCLLYPSSYEGFGIPVVEAMRAGCPVVSTNKSSIPEVAGDGALLVNDIEVSSFVDEINKLSNADFRDDLVKKGFSQSKKFTWDKCFEETYQFYEQVYNRKYSK